MMAVSILIPVYNEQKIMEKSVSELREFLKKSRLKYEIIICNNGSTDNTEKIGWKLSRLKNVTFFSIPKKGSVGTAFSESLKMAKHDKIISLDMDLSIDFLFITDCNKLLDNYDIVMGSKTIGDQKRSFSRKLVSNMYIILTDFLFGITYSDYSMAAKGYRKSKITGYTVGKGSSYVMETVYFGSRDNLKIKEIPVSCVDTRKSKFSRTQEVIDRSVALIKFRIRTMLK
jgi:glycosyltransferase involved in cell wall biosynthesis